MVTATSFGARFFSRFAQRAAMMSNAVESDPPETASRSPRRPSRPSNSALASSSRTASSTVGTLLFPVHALPHVSRSARIFAQHLAKRGTGRFLLAQSGERLAEPQKRLGRASRGLILGGNGEKRFGRIAILLLLEQAFAKPVLGLRRLAIARILAQERAEGVRGECIIPVQNIAVGEIVDVLGRIAGRQRRLHRAGRARIGGRRPWQFAARAAARRHRHGGEVERGTGFARTGRTDCRVRYGRRTLIDRRRFVRRRAVAE